MAGRPGPDRSETPRARNLYLAAALLPLVPALGSIVAAIGPGAWSSITTSLVRAGTPDALLYSAVCVVVVAPVAGVAVTAARRKAAERGSPSGSAVDDARQLAIATAILCAISAALTVLRLGGGAETLSFVATSHAVLAAATLALAALGALLGTLLRDPLDAAAIALVIAMTAAYGVLVAGAPVGELPAPLLTAALLASPVMAVASAAHVDLVRADIWYQISPLAHVQVEYPTWGAACASYLLAGCTAFLAMTRHRNGRRGAHAIEQSLGAGPHPPGL
jgi:hypothetical protein